MSRADKSASQPISDTLIDEEVVTCDECKLWKGVLMRSLFRCELISSTSVLCGRNPADDVHPLFTERTDPDPMPLDGLNHDQEKIMKHNAHQAQKEKIMKHNMQTSKAS